MRILVVRLSALGDVLLATPALAALRRRFPDAHLDLCTDARYAPLFEGHPALSGVVPHERRGGARSLARVWREGRYDVVVDLQHKLRTVLAARWARTGRRITFTKRRPRDWLPSLLGWPLRTGAHAVDLYVRALADLDVPTLAPAERRLHVNLSPSAVAQAEALLDERGMAATPWIAVAPGAAHATKRWGSARWAALGALVRERGLGEPLAVGGPGDAQEIAASGLPTAPLDLPLPTLAALLSRARALVAGDTGPMHLAGAVGTPVLGLYGPTDPTRWGPLGPRDRVLTLRMPCSPCSDHGGPRCPLGTHACLRDLAPERVADTLGELIRA